MITASALQQLTLADFLADVVDMVNDFVPDLAIYIAAAVVVGLVAWAGKKLIKVGR